MVGARGVSGSSGGARLRNADIIIPYATEITCATLSGAAGWRHKRRTENADGGLMTYIRTCWAAVASIRPAWS